MTLSEKVYTREEIEETWINFFSCGSSSYATMSIHVVQKITGEGAENRIVHYSYNNWKVTSFNGIIYKLQSSPIR